MPIRRRIESHIGRMDLDDLIEFTSGNTKSLTAVYGSLENARAFYDHAIATGQHRQNLPDRRSPIWWLTEPGIPDELREPEESWSVYEDADDWDRKDAERDAFDEARRTWLAEHTKAEEPA
jgi:hypothetical protein